MKHGEARSRDSGSGCTGVPEQGTARCGGPRYPDVYAAVIVACDRLDLVLVLVPETVTIPLRNQKGDTKTVSISTVVRPFAARSR